MENIHGLHSGVGSKLKGGGLDLSKIVTPVLPPVPTPIHYKLLHIYILYWESKRNTSCY